MTRGTVAGVLVVSLTTLAALGCGGSGSADEPTGYLAKPSNGAAFIQWTRTDASVSGSLTIARRVADEGYESVEKDNASFEGIISGKSITLTLGGSNWNGTLDGDELTLTFAGEDGSLTTLNFRPANVSDYNDAVSELQGSVRTANAEQAQQEAEAEAIGAIDGASASVAEDLTKLDRSVRAAQADLGDVPGSLAAEQEAVDKTYAALQKTLRTADPSDCAYEASGVAYEASGVEYERSGVDSELGAVNSDLQAIDDALAQLRADFQKLQGALALSEYRPADLPTRESVSSARAAARSSVAEVIKTGRGYRKKSNALAQTAQGYSDRAFNAC